MENSMEGKHEKILTKSGVIEVISCFVESFTIVRELSDNQGLYLLEVRIPDREPNGIIEYQYMRKGVFKKDRNM